MIPLHSKSAFEKNTIVLFFMIQGSSWGTNLREILLLKMEPAMEISSTEDREHPGVRETKYTMLQQWEPALGNQLCKGKDRIPQAKKYRNRRLGSGSYMPNSSLEGGEPTNQTYPLRTTQETGSYASGSDPPWGPAGGSTSRVTYLFTLHYCKARDLLSTPLHWVD